MGLDMYLIRKKYVGAKYKHNNVTGVIDIRTNGKTIPIDLKKVSYIEEEVGYWRKANAIHNWFVENIQDGEDDCREYWVSVEQLQELLDICKKVLENHNLAEDLLPSKPGFFFGSTEYDEYYFQDIQDTIDILTKVIEEEKEYNKNDFYSDLMYNSSW